MASEIESILTTIQGYVDGLEAALGEVQATPTTYTVLARLKDLSDRLGEVSSTPTANTMLARLKTLEGYLDGVEAALGTQTDAEATGNGSLIAIVKRLRTLVGQGIVTLGSAIGTTGLLMAGSDGTNARAIKTTSDGTLLTQLTGSRLFKTAPDRRLEIWLNRLDFLTADHDSIAIGAMAKGDLSIPFDSVTSGGTSREILCAGFNALLLHHVITGAPATGGYATITMSPKSGGTFVAHHGDGQNIQTAAVTASYISLFRGILDYVKVVLNVTDGTHTVIVQPLNI